MRWTYYSAALAAILAAGVLLTIQIIGGLEHTAGASLYTKASMVTAMVYVAAMPLFVHFAWRVGKVVSMALFIGFCCFLGYSLPATIGRVGEAPEARAMAAGDAGVIRQKIADLDRTLSFAEPDMLAECARKRGRTDECRRKKASVSAFLSERGRHQADLDRIGTASVGDVSSINVVWALGALGIAAKEVAIRRGSGIAFAVALEVSIFALTWLAAALITSAVGLNARSRSLVERAPRVEPATSDELVAETDDEPEPMSDRVFSRERAERDLVTLLAMRSDIPSQRWLAERWGVEDGTVSRWVTRWEAEGLSVRDRIGRSNRIVAAA